jgi:predicted RNA-binding protein YlqC (UPF0109 family)
MTEEQPSSIADTQDLVRKIAWAFVDDESAVRIEIIPSEHGTVFRLYSAENDVGKLIGKHGRNAQALRVIITAIGLTQGVHYNLDIVDPLHGSSQSLSPKDV